MLVVGRDLLHGDFTTLVYQIQQMKTIRTLHYIQVLLFLIMSLKTNIYNEKVRNLLKHFSKLSEHDKDLLVSFAETMEKAKS